MKTSLAVLFCVMLFACSHTKRKAEDYATKQINLKPFTIVVPSNWEYKKAQGIDSFVGDIVGPNVSLSFDCSDMGYANHLIYSAEEWLKKENIGWSRSLDITYTNVSKTLAKPTVAQKKQYPEADYVVRLALKDSIVIIPVKIPNEIKNHYIQIDTTSEYIIKTIHPKITGKGLTGIYIQKRNSSFNFQMNGTDLPMLQQAQALRAFKTIKFAK